MEWCPIRMEINFSIGVAQNEMPSKDDFNDTNIAYLFTREQSFLSYKNVTRTITDC